MKNTHYLVPALLLMGCASPKSPTVAASSAPLPKKHESSVATDVRTLEQVKAYPIGRYEDPDDPDVMHEGHTVYRAETSPEWDTDPNETTSLPLGPGEMATADPSQEHVALTAELEQRLKQEDQLLQTTYEQNKKLAEEIEALQAGQQHALLPIPSVESPVASPQPKPPADTAPQPPPVTPPTASRTWRQWLWPNSSTSTSTPKGN